MKELLSQRFFDNSLALYLQVASVIVLTLLLKRVLSKYLGTMLLKIFIKGDKVHHNEPFITYIVKRLEIFIVLFVVIISLNKLQFPEALKFDVYRISFSDLLDGIADTILIIAFIRLCLGFIYFGAIIFEERARLTNNAREGQFVVFFRDFFKVLIYIAGALMILKITFGYDITKLLTGLSIVGAAIALATRESLENLIASFIIFFDKPFTTGDTVKVQSFTGTVERIGLRSTRIRTDQKTYITVPNKQMVDTILDNLSLRTQRRGEIKLDLETGISTEKLTATLNDIKHALSQRQLISFTVWLSSTGKNGNQISIEYFKGMDVSLHDFNFEHQQLLLDILDILRKNETPIVSPVYIKADA